MTHYNIILCTDINGGISKNGIIPWKIQEDKNFFIDTITSKNDNKPNIIIMGKNTYEQMNLIKGHVNIIISKTLTNIDSNEAYIFSDLDDATKYIDSLLKTNSYGKVFVCGGKSIYEYFLNNTNNTLHWTLINKSYDCDNVIDIKSLEKFTTKNIYSANVYDSLNNINVNIEFKSGENDYINKDEQHYLDVMKNILDNGQETKCRNGYTYSKFGEMIKFDLDSFPLLTTKKMFLKGIFEELMFFIRGETNTKKLYDKGVKIWEKNTTKEFIEKCNLNYEEFDMGPMYGFQWRHFNAQYNGMNDTYEDKGYDQLKYVINELKTNPNSRRILMTTYNPAQASQGVLFPCHGISIQFNTEHVNDNTYKLNISQNQRSCDYFLGVPFNIASYALLNYMICHVINNDTESKFKYVPGKLVMFLGDYHIYKEHLIQARRQILRVPKQFPKLMFKRNVNNIEDFKLEDIDLQHYNSYPTISAQMIA